jgi:hypothetical protein
MSHILLGARGDMGYTFNQWAGYFDEFAIYNGILSADRVLAHYAAWQPKTCQEVIDRGYDSIADLNGDCKVNFLDFAELALNWAKCNDPLNSKCTKNWPLNE